MGSLNSQTKYPLIVQNPLKKPTNKWVHKPRTRKLQHVQSYWQNSAFRWKYPSKRGRSWSVMADDMCSVLFLWLSSSCYLSFPNTMHY